MQSSEPEHPPKVRQWKGLDYASLFTPNPDSESDELGEGEHEFAKNNVTDVLSSSPQPELDIMGDQYHLTAVMSV